MHEDEIHLPTGRRIYAYATIIGIKDNLNVFHGYDSRMFSWPDETHFGTPGWSDADLHALADMMLARWVAFKAKIDHHIND